MALNKRWVGTTAVYTLETNWAPISLRSPTYRWLLSGSGTSEYYLDLAGGGNPGISTPTAGMIYLNGASVTSQTLGSLTAAHYGYGDNDALGYSTVYVRTSGSVDPDTLALDYVQLYQIPVAGDFVRIPNGSGAITGTDQSSVSLGGFVVEEGHTNTIGSATLPLSITTSGFEYSGTGISYINLAASAISPDIRNATTGQSGSPGLFLTGSALSVLTVLKGTVGLAALFGQTATATTVRVNGQSGALILGKNASITNVYCFRGTILQNCAATTVSVYGGTLTTEESGAITTLNIDEAGNATLNSTGTITTLNMQAALTGIVDMLQSAEARTITTLNQKAGTIKLDKGIVTVGTWNVTDSKPQQVAITNAA